MLADRLREQGNLAEATWVCARGLASNPHYSTGHTILAEILREAGLSRRAKEEFLLGLDLEAFNARARLGLARLLVEEGDAKGALEHVDYLLFWQPDHEEGKKVAEQARLLLRSQEVETLLGPAEEAAPPPEQEALAVPPPAGLIPGREGELCALLADCESVSGAIVMNKEGLVVASELNLRGLKDEVAAGLTSLCETSNRYLLRLGLGYLEGGLIEGEALTLRIFRYQDYVVAVSLKPEAKLGPAEIEISGAMTRLDRRRKVRTTDTLPAEFLPEKKHA